MQTMTTRYFLITTEYFLYGESIIYYFTEIVMVDRFLLPFATHHRFISFMLYVLGKDLFNNNKVHFHSSVIVDRFRVLCRQFEKGTIFIPNGTILLHPYGFTFDCRSESLYCREHLGRIDLVSRLERKREKDAHVIQGLSCRLLW